MMVKKAIIPVAGLGTRFLPATKAQPKEMLAVVDKPVIQYLVEEAVASGIREVIFVTGRSKRAIEDHFDYAPELEAKLLSKKKQEDNALIIYPFIHAQPIVNYMRDDKARMHRLKLYNYFQEIDFFQPLFNARHYNYSKDGNLIKEDAWTIE